MSVSKRCQAITSKGKLCRHTAILGRPFCAIHEKIAPSVAMKRRKLSRQDILRLIDKNGGAFELDLGHTDLTGLKLGSSAIKMPILDGLVFGHYGYVRSGTVAEGTFFERNSMRNATLIYANLKKANFFNTDLTNSDIRFADLTDATCVNSNLNGANLVGARLVNTNLQGASLHLADLYLTVFDGHTEITQESIGEFILQENEQEYKHFIERSILPTSKNPLSYHLFDRYLKAAKVYEQLRIHFESNGKISDSVWAYLKERRMRKKWKGKLSWASIREGRIVNAFYLLLSYLSDWIVEILCDYGESAWRVLFWIMSLLFVFGPLTILLSGGLVWTGSNVPTYYSLDTEFKRQLYSYFQLLLYSLDTITTANFSDLRPYNDLVRISSGVLASLGIFLLGLLGFVSGNRIRR